MSSVLDDIFALYRREGSRAYGPERLSQLQHGLQCARNAERFGAGADMIAAALLHDYGHLVGTDDDDLLRLGAHTWHAAVGARLLARSFPPAVTEPIRLHVAAKRHLCATDHDYFQTLSPGSLLTLKQQGGLLTPAESRSFLAEPFARAAMLLRRWDDMAKDPAAETPDLDYFRPHVSEALAGAGDMARGEDFRRALWPARARHRG